jgi:hypothetical protein
MVMCLVRGAPNFEEERLMGVDKPTSWETCCSVQMSVYCQADSRRQSGKVQGETDDKRI